jgi:hypothetical protein
MKLKKFFTSNEFLHYIIGTLVIIFGGHELSMRIGLEQWAGETGTTGMAVLFVYYLVIYIFVDQALHKLLGID